MLERKANLYYQKKIKGYCKNFEKEEGERGRIREGEGREKKGRKGDLVKGERERVAVHTEWKGRRGGEKGVGEKDWWGQEKKGRRE